MKRKTVYSSAADQQEIDLLELFLFYMGKLPLLIAAMGSAYTPDYGMIMVGIVLATVPIIILFLTMQKQFVRGMLGSVK